MTHSSQSTSQLHDQMIALGDGAKRAQRVVQRSPHAMRQTALKAAAVALRGISVDLLGANAADVAQAREMGKDDAFIDRLALDEGRIEGMAKSLEAIAARPDPLGAIDQSWQREDGMRFERARVPLGVIAVIFESRPNVAADAAGLCLKAGNATILRGGSESRRSVEMILSAMQKGLEQAGLPMEAVNIVPTQDRDAVGELFRMTEHIDLLIPRGGRSLVARVQEESRVPVLGHLMGVNHSYVHASADLEMAKAVVVNAKMRRTGVCGATETLLIDEAVAAKYLPPLVKALSDAQCRVRGDAAAKAICPDIEPASDEDWDTEWLDAVINVRVVDGLDAALAHIDRHGSGHTECIIASDQAAADRFLSEVDAAIVMHNASTQFADGGEFGFGAEIGIATGRLHARGPVGAEHLTSYHYRVRGSGHIRP
ncbi:MULTISPECIES: glutamate-5-semialdehyde dehydrogenase [unclassified Iodidimonas]|uniref:glutamate-5-semialdehyde dehydrogenase n=1 Tax=unclassified Iodidimonas TaxID=2626145 RepID=UPI002483135E|nr:MULTISPECIES: glutamate-5-semialdehyde dehydrogenase [unclassified Iodidimonas]